MPASIPPPPAPDAAADASSADLFDYALARDYAVLLLGAPARRKTLFAVVFVSVLVLTLGVLLLLPKSYTAETRILTQRTGRYLPGDDTPLRAASELVFSQANLESMVQQTGLVATYEKSRSPLGRLRDALLGKFSGTPHSEEFIRDALAGTLERKIRVSVDESTVSIAVSWPDPQTAYKLVLAAQQNFLSGKQASETSAITGTMAIFEAHADAVRRDIDAQLDRLRATLARERQVASARPAPRAQSKAAAAPAPSALNSKVESLLAILSAKRAAVREREAEQARRTSEIEADLARLRSLYTENHPLVIDATQRLESARAEPPQLASARSEVAMLEQAIAAEGGTVPAALPPTRAADAHPLSLPREVTAPNPTGNPELDFEAAQLRLLITKYNNLLDRLDNARIDLETTQAAFSQRYTVTRPPQIPLKPDNLKPPLVVAAGTVLGLVLALFVTAAVELIRGRIRRRWQIERGLGLPVLAEIAAP